VASVPLFFEPKARRKEHGGISEATATSLDRSFVLELGSAAGESRRFVVFPNPSLALQASMNPQCLSWGHQFLSCTIRRSQWRG